jgi:hypothetical protein
MKSSVVKLKGLVLARQALYHLSHFPTHMKKLK